jgi:4-hydroxy-tetrahydrodipicolinate synthase
MIAKSLSGTGVALVTPFRKSGEIDFTSLRKLISHTLDGGVNFVVTLGTTGEASTLSEHEQMAVIDFTLDTINRKVPVVVGVSGNNTQDCVRKLKEFCSNNSDHISAVLNVTPFYSKPSPIGLFEHFRAVAGASPVPIIIYNVPSRTGTNLPANTCLRLAEDNNNIIGIKEASGDMSQCMEILASKPKEFLFLSGNDDLTFPLMAMGANGVISVTANAYPNRVSSLVNHCKKCDYKEALTLHEKLLPFTRAIFSEGSPCGIKAALEIIEICESNLRLPLVKSSLANYNQIKKTIEQIDEK